MNGAITKLAATISITPDPQLDSGTLGTRTGLGNVSPALMASYVINWGLTLLGLVFLVLIIYAGFSWMTAGGEEEKITKAKKMLSSSVIGLLIVLASYGISFYVFLNVLHITQ
jgi:uncharacterized BrkB/YihY/UPF0761 family membrane protein